uniref:Uncharacterized protein n=1 Tax=viral metagenome TaxID=1070528 RepID=A0A6C0HTA0_9ZZZZ
MELTLEPELYSPSIDELGNYIDKIPCITRGIKCSCCSRKDKIYESRSVFASHTKTKVHQNWLSTINLNKANYYVENEKMKTTLQNQRLIIAKMEKDLQHKIMTIDYLTQQLTCINNNKIVNNLLEFD